MIIGRIAEHPNPTTKIPTKMGGAATPEWDPIGFAPQSYVPGRTNGLLVKTLVPGTYLYLKGQSGTSGKW